MTTPHSEPGRDFNSRLRMLADIWSNHLSGELEVHVSAHQRRAQRLMVSEGGVVERHHFVSLNAALRNGRLQFTPRAVTRSADWEAMGRFLYDKAYHAVLRTEPAAESLPLYAVTCSPQALAAVTCSEEEAPLLLDVSGLAATDPRVSRLRALELMGLVASAERAAAAECSAAAQPEWESLLADFAPLLEDAAESPPPAQPLAVARAVALLVRGCCAEARAQLEAELLVNMEAPEVQSWMAICWLADDEASIEARVGRAQQWSRLAEQLALDTATLPHHTQPVFSDAASAILATPASYRLPRELRKWLRGQRATPAAPPAAPRLTQRMGS